MLNFFYWFYHHFEMFLKIMIFFIKTIPFWNKKS